jgi:hypothetical protein
VIDWTRRHALAIGVIVFGAAFFVVLNKLEGPRGADRDDT